MIQHTFSGNIFIFYSFDVGEDINLERIKRENLVQRVPLILSKYFKSYHIPLGVELPHPHATSHCDSAKIHSFGVITLRYKIPFHGTLDELRTKINSIDQDYQDQSVEDAGSLFKRIKTAIKQPQFFSLRKSYMLIQVNPQPEHIDAMAVKEQCGNAIASILRFETETLAEHKKNEILATAFGYYRGDLIIIDTEAAFLYDDEYEEVLDLFEFGNIQHLELQYFDKLLDQRLNQVYERESQSLPLHAYIPFWSTLTNDPVAELGKLRVDISVITERLENSIKLAEEPYYSEMYTALADKLDLINWKESLQNKLSIIQDMSEVYDNKANVIRQDILSVLIVFLVFMEFAVGLLNLLK